jgi:hypothetical protein
MVEGIVGGEGSGVAAGLRIFEAVGRAEVAGEADLPVEHPLRTSP